MYYNPYAITTVLSMNDVVNIGAQITYDTDVERDIYVKYQGWRAELPGTVPFKTLVEGAVLSSTVQCKTLEEGA